MGIESEPKKFQQHIVASFTKPQIQNIEAWVRNNVVLTEGSNYLQTFSRALKAAGVDEKGKVMDGKSRKRIKYGMLVISELHKRKQDLDQVEGPIKVWKVSPEEDNLSVRFELKKSRRNPRNNRLT